MRSQPATPLEETLYAKVIKICIDKGASIDAQNSQGDTPLHQVRLA